MSNKISTSTVVDCIEFARYFSAEDGVKGRGDKPANALGLLDHCFCYLQMKDGRSVIGYSLSNHQTEFGETAFAHAFKKARDLLETDLENGIEVIPAELNPKVELAAKHGGIAALLGVKGAVYSKSCTWKPEPEETTTGDNEAEKFNQAVDGYRLNVAGSLPAERTGSGSIASANEFGLHSTLPNHFMYISDSDKEFIKSMKVFSPVEEVQVSQLKDAVKCIYDRLEAIEKQIDRLPA